MRNSNAMSLWPNAITLQRLQVEDANPSKERSYNLPENPVPLSSLLSLRELSGNDAD